MLLGPVFNVELITTARRARYYVVRFVYGLIVLCQIYLSYNANSYRFNNRGTELTIREMAEFGSEIFTAFAIVQAVVVLLLTPALVGGTIAEERQRKTLHYLLTSELTGFEIIFGKLAARLLHVVVLVALGLPVVSLIGLFGGIDFKWLVLSYAGTLTTVYFLATMSILVSVFSRRPREAISVLYVFEFAWLGVPPLLMSWMPYWVAPWPAIYPWIAPALEYVAITSPFYLIPTMIRNPTGLETTAFWGMGLQVAYGTIFLILAAFRLRPSSRNEGGHGRLADLSRVLGRRRRWLGRPACGDDAMLWKERYVSRTGGMTKAVMALIGLIILGIIAYSSYDFIKPAVAELLTYGYSDNSGPARRDFNSYLRGISTAIYLLWMLGIASAAASGLSSEREEDTWLSLTATPLDGGEILRAKMLGPVWALRPVAFLLFALWAIGLAVGSIHPLGLAACLVELAVFTWFLTAIGTFFSLRSRNSTPALASTMALLIFLNGAYMFCCIPFRPNTSVIAAGATPFVFAFSLASPHDLEHMSGRYVGESVTACILSVFLYGIAAAGLTSALFGTFDAAVNRPDRLRQDLTPAQQREKLKGRSKEIIFPDEIL